MRSKGGSLGQVAGSVLVAFVLLYVLVTAVPAAYPGVLVGLFERLPNLNGDTFLEEVTLDGTEGHFQIRTKMLQGFLGPDGKPGPEIELVYDFDLSVYNAYPLMVLTMLASIPYSIRRRLLLLGYGMLALVVIGLLDLAVIWLWMRAEGMALAAQDSGFFIADIGTNRVVFEEMQRWMDRVTVLKSFLSTGGRQLLAALAVGVCVVAVYPFSSRADPETEGDSEAGAGR
jgi:hypothetical protein